MNSDFFLISSYDPLPQDGLYGFCFQDEDLILGHQGYEKYRAARQKLILPGQDGAYIVVRNSDEETVIGTDYSGYSKLFLYQRGERWALSNSLIQLVRFAADKNLPVTIDEDHLASFFIEGPFGDQLTSFRTSVKEIRLVPSTMEAVIRSVFYGTAVMLRPTSLTDRHGNYGEALETYLRLWVGRMMTLLQSDLHIRCDLTGGRDSRAVLSLIRAAAQNIGGNLIQKVNFTSDSDAKGDFAIATSIAERYRLRFMDRSTDPRLPIRLDTIASYSKWKTLCLGVYGPIYFPITRPVPTALALGGAGGEGHRRFYPDMAPYKFINAQRRFIPSKAQFRRLKQDILEDLSTLQHGFESSVHPLIVHYRHFRDRCHGGRGPQYGHLLAPLSSATLRQASSLCSPVQIERSQVLADILINADSELAAMPYDQPSKSFDADHFRESVNAREAIRSAHRNGQVFAAQESDAESGDFAKDKAFRLLKEDFLDHYERMRGASFYPRHYLETARKNVEEAALQGRFRNPRSGCLISHVILAGELSRLSR